MSPPAPSWLTADEVAEHLGVSLAEVYEQIAAGRLPAQRYAEGFLMRRADVEAFTPAPSAIAS